MIGVREDIVTMVTLANLVSRSCLSYYTAVGAGWGGGISRDWYVPDLVGWLLEVSKAGAYTLSQNLKPLCLDFPLTTPGPAHLPGDPTCKNDGSF